MTTVYGLPGDDPGDQMVFRVFRDYLSSDFLIYAQPKIVHGEQSLHPDYVILHRQMGVIVIEVKDWVRVIQRNAKEAYVYRTTKGKEEWDYSPVEDARKAAILISNKLRKNDELTNCDGKLDFPYRYAGILPNLPLSTITWLEEAWGKNAVLGRNDLTRENISRKILSIPAPFTQIMTEKQFDAVRVVLDEANAVRDSRTGQLKGIYSQKQEEIAKSAYTPPDKTGTVLETPSLTQQEMWGDISPDPHARITQLESDAPDEVLKLQKASNIKLVRGFSGTGKTDVLVMRARYLYDLYPELKILVTTFNVPLVEERLEPEFKKHKDRIHVHTFDSLCQAIYKKHTGTWPTIQDVGGLIKGMVSTGGTISDLIQKFGAGFVEQEILWMKEIGFVDEEKYLSTHREGRAKTSGRTLSQSAKKQMLQIFTTYQKKLDDIRAFDWPDMHQKVWDFFQEGETPEHNFDLIFVDEAQHFAPLWLKIILEYLKPNGSIFMCDDPSQSVYRYFSWQQKGVTVQGKTRWLKVPYRTTREIFEAAYSLIQSNPLAKTLMDECGKNVTPDLTENVRTGDRPKAHCFGSYEKEKNLCKKKLRS
jgi:hypothetical protein